MEMELEVRAGACQSHQKSEQGTQVHIALWLVLVLVWLGSLACAYYMGKRTRINVQEAVGEPSTELDQVLLCTLEKKYRAESLRRAAKAHGCCPGYGARKGVVIEALMRKGVLTAAGHETTMRTFASAPVARVAP